MIVSLIVTISFFILGFLLPVLQQLLCHSRIGLNISSPFAAVLVPTPDLAHQVSNDDILDN